MPRESKLTDEQWQECRGLREAGKTWQFLADRYCISRKAIQNRSKLEGWLNPEMNREVLTSSPR